MPDFNHDIRAARRSVQLRCQRIKHQTARRQLPSQDAAKGRRPTRQAQVARRAGGMVRQAVRTGGRLVSRGAGTGLREKRQPQLLAERR